MRLGIQGSRSLDDERIEQAIEQEIARQDPEAIVTSAEIDGVCRLARQIAQRKRIALTVHYTNRANGRGMHDRRSKAIQADCDWVLFIHDGESKGTAGEIALARKTRKPHTVVTIAQRDMDEKIEAWMGKLRDPLEEGA